MTGKRGGSIRGPSIRRYAMHRLTELGGDAPSRRTPLTRSERLIAGGRIVLAMVALVAVWIDPDQPRHHVTLTYAALAGYLAYATAVAVLVARPPVAPPWLPLATQAIDIAISPVLMYLTEGPASPFFLYFLFPILSATLRWHLLGTIWTAGISLVVFLGLGAVAWQTLPDESLDPPRFVIRTSFLGVMAALLGALGAHENALRGQLLGLARGTRSLAIDTEELAADALRRAAILDAPRVVMAWEDSEEPWLNVESKLGGEATFAREASSTWEPLVAGPLADACFLCEDADSPAAAVDRETPAGFERWKGAPLHPGFRERFGVATVLSVPLRGAHIQGRLFWLDRPSFTADDLMLGQIVAGQVAPCSIRSSCSTGCGRRPSTRNASASRGTFTTASCNRSRLPHSRCRRRATLSGRSARRPAGGWPRCSGPWSRSSEASECSLDRCGRARRGRTGPRRRCASGCAGSPSASGACGAWRSESRTRGCEPRSAPASSSRST